MYRIVNMETGSGKGAHRATCDILFNIGVGIYGVKLFMGKRGLFISMPSVKRGNAYVETCGPFDKGLKESLTVDVITKYNEKIKGVSDI